MSEWKCEVCDQVVYQRGPWCDLYCGERRVVCLAVLLELRDKARADGLESLVDKYTAILDASYDWRDL